MKIDFIDGTNVAMFQLELGRIEREKIWGRLSLGRPSVRQFRCQL